MELHVITRPEHPRLPFIRSLYESTFPVEERRDWHQFLQLLQEPAMQLSVILDEGASIGFVTGWKLNSWYYVEHLAIDPSQRGKKYGQKVMQSVLAAGHGRVILEVERAHDKISQRRIGFYERLGFIIVDIDYHQPPYRKGEAALPMLLMSNPAITDEMEAKAIAGNIRASVYERYY
ncbi:GNAT family N-acetyltransferase [Pseudoflavitalea rhizosphaerae]|uniref:GNAT family N-acetyltransferase n=1 Tax=Pseudoflavitalea rhizosphaerae TaxID=1884793 RepID=UPI000F8D660B|nr:GNAT family N-acetyltransferase [Pseudoflavitalea rhizosphaerae]